MTASIFDYRGKRVHFIGVGGSSMSGLTALLMQEGWIVSGSDRTKSHKTDALEEKGVQIFIGQKAENVRGADVIVFSAAISPENPERAEGRRLGIPRNRALRSDRSADGKFQIRNRRFRHAW